MQANIESSSVTEVSLSSCANITLTDTGESINLSNSYPMSKTRALETTPYTLTITSSCEDGSGYNLYLATLNTNTLSASSIHYIITEHGNQNIVVEGMLSDASDGISDFEDYDIDQLNNGINGTYGSVYRLYSSGIQYNTEVSYDLYLYIDESVTNETMGQTFVAGVAVKASDYDFATVNGVSVTEATTDSITVSVNASNGTNNITNYYYSINNGEYVSSASNTYTFEGLDTGTTYDIKVYVVDTNGVQSNIYSTSWETSSITLADYITSLYTTDGENGLYYHDGQGSYTNADQEAGDNSYRFSGADPNNYVCFGSNEGTCPEDNLYRIIGVFDNQVKLIKVTNIGKYAWDTSAITFSSEEITGISNTNGEYDVLKLNGILAAPGQGESGENDWTTADINYYINGDAYYNKLGLTWQNLITEKIWYLGGYSTYDATAKNFYVYERGNTVYSGRPTEWKGKIGLMYASDYGYAASPENWKTNLGSYSNDTNRNNNWMYMKLQEWTITPYSSAAYSVFYLDYFDDSASSGRLSLAATGFIYFVRPVFYLESNVGLASGNGTLENPYCLAV